MMSKYFEKGQVHMWNGGHFLAYFEEEEDKEEDEEEEAVFYSLFWIFWSRPAVSSSKFCSSWNYR